MNSQKYFNTSEYSLYLPAVNPSFASGVLKKLSPNRPFPSEITLRDLQFWRSDSKLFHYPYALHSMGQYSIGSTIVNSITYPQLPDTILVGDSGGFQLGKGTFKGYKALEDSLTADDAISAWNDAYEVKQWILVQLETYFNYSMTIDIPLWATKETSSNAKFRNCSKDQLTQLTVDNLQFIDIHRHNKTKWLNVIQGLDWDSTKYWWDRVSWFKCHGYALAGGAGGFGGLAQVLKSIFLIRDEIQSTSKLEWIHVLGVSTPPLAIMLSAIQRNLRKQFPDVRISYDSASAFQTGGRYETPAFIKELNKDDITWSISHTDSSTVHASHLAQDDLDFPFPSAIGDLLKSTHLNVNSKKNAQRNFDTVSNMLLINHNVWTYLKIFEMANDAAFKDATRSQVPDKFCAALDLIDKAFEVDNWEKFIDTNIDIFNAVSKNTYMK